MSNSEPSHMEHEIQQDHSRVLEQQIFTRGVLGYCTHFDIPNKNYYNINFPHFQDFESLYHQEKFLKQNLKSALMNSNPEFPYLSELDKALENILIAKNNYQRIMLQMLDTIYYQEQRSKQQSVFLEVHNTVTSQKDAYIEQLKNALSYLAGNSQTISQSPATHNSINDKTSRKETSKTPRNTSERKKTPTQTLSNYSSQRSLALKQRDLNIDLGGYMSKQMKKSGTPCVSYRAKSPQVGANTQKTHQTPRTKSISSSRHNSISTLKSGREEMSKEVNKKASYFSRRGSETTYSARLEESSNGKEKRRMSLKGNKSVSKETVQGNGVKRERNMTWNMAENGVEDIGEKRLISISSIQEDCNDHEYDSFKINRTKTAPNNERTEITESSGYYHYKEDGYRVLYNKQERLGSEYLATTQNKSISFQSSTGNLFQETENIRGDDGVLREVGSHRENCVWPRETINTERDQVYGEKPWDLMEGNIVTSPSFGMQTAYTERSFSQKLGENKNRGKLERHEKKQGENVMVGKFYGQSSVAKKKTWTPLLSKKY